jgi:type IV fimbrial biogenesis protein FimT
MMTHAIRLRRGFTLLEVIVVMILLAVMGGIAVPAFRSLFVEDELTTATHRLEALFHLARDSAIRAGIPVTVLIDSVSNNIWLDSPARPVDTDTLAAAASLSGRTLSRTTMSTARPDTGQSLELPYGVSIALTRARARFTFAASGAAFADSLVLRSALGERLLTIHPWTGDVLVW